MTTKELKELADEYGLEYTYLPIVHTHYIFFVKYPIISVLERVGKIICRYANLEKLSIYEKHLYSDDIDDGESSIEAIRNYIEACLKRYKELKKEYRIKEITEL